MKSVEEIVAAVLKVDPSEIDDTTGAGTHKAWDSLASILLVAELERALDINFSLEEAMEMKSVGDIKTIIKKHGRG